MRVMAMLHAYPPAHGAGAEWMAHSLFRALITAGHSVDVVLSRNDLVKDRYELDGVQVHPFRNKHTAGPFLATCDVIVTHLENTPRASVLGRMHGRPVVHLLHNTFTPTKGWIRTGKPKLLVFNSQWMRVDYQTWMADRGVPEMDSIVVHPPVYADDYRTSPGEHVTLINLTEPKGANVFYALAEKFLDQKFLGVTGGYGVQVVKDLPNVEIIPNTANMRDDVYARTKVLLVPSDYESWGRVAVEAMCSGIPVLAHPTPGLRESTGPAGTFAHRERPREWATALRKLLSTKGWAAASKRASRRAAELDPTEDLDRFVTHIEQLPAKYPRRRHG